MKILLLLLIFITPALAKNKFNFGVGAGISYANNFVKNDSSKKIKNGKYGGTAFPAISFEYGKFAIRGLGARYSFFGNKSLFNFKLNLRYFGPEYVNQYVSKRAPSFFGGASIRLLILNLRYNTDISSKSNGSIFDAYLMFPFKLTNWWIFMPRIGVEKFSENFMNHYYGIAPHEAVEFSPYSFSESTSMVPAITLGNMFLPTDWLAIRFMLTYRNLPPEVTNSPIVNGNDQFSSVFLFVVTI